MSKDNILVALAIIAFISFLTLLTTAGEIIAIRKKIPSEHRECMCWIGASGSIVTLTIAIYLFVIY